MGMPSIIVGIFAYTLMVVPLGHFSGYAGALALAILMLPVITRTTEDMLRLVPNTLRESALALGAPRWKVTLGIVFRAAKTGLITGILLAVARVSGETAPLLFTALNSPYWVHSLKEPTPNLTVTIFNYAMSPYPDWQQKAWGASLLITVSVLILTISARFCLREKKSEYTEILTMSSHNLTLPLIGRLNLRRRNANLAPREAVRPQLGGRPATPMQVVAKLPVAASQDANVIESRGAAGASGSDQ